MKSMTLEHEQDQRPKRPYRPRKRKTTLYDEEDVPEIVSVVSVPKPVNWGEGLRLLPGQKVDLGRWHDKQLDALPVNTTRTSVFETSSQVDTLPPEKRRAILRDNSTI